MTLVSYALNHEDVVLWRAFKQLTTGFYLAVGAKAVREGSGTYAFYQQGWRGITLEASPYWFELLSDLRPNDINLAMAVAVSGENLTLYHAPDENLTTFDAQQAHYYQQAHYEVVSQQVPTITLDQVCSHYAITHIDLLRIEVEGSMFAVLQTLNLQQYRPTIIALVQNKLAIELNANTELKDYLAAWRYTLAYHDGLNHLYVAQEKPELVGLLKYPPNQHDHYITAQAFQLQQQIQQLQQQLAAEQATPAHNAVANADSSALEKALWGEGSAQEGIKGQLQRSNTGLRLIFARQQKLEQALWQLAQSHREQTKLEEERLRQQATGFQQHLVDMEERFKQREQEWHQHVQHLQQQRQQRENELQQERLATQAELDKVYKSRAWRSTKPLRVLSHYLKPIARKIVEGGSAWLRFTPASRPRRMLRKLKQSLARGLRYTARLLKRLLQRFPTFNDYLRQYLAKHPSLHSRLKNLSRAGFKSVDISTGLSHAPSTLSPKAADIYRKLHNQTKGFGQ